MQKRHVEIVENGILQALCHAGCCRNVLAREIALAFDSDARKLVVIFLVFFRALSTRVALFGGQAHQRAHHIDLLAALKRFTCRIVCYAALASGQDFCSALRACVRALPQIRKRQVAEKR